MSDPALAHRVLAGLIGTQPAVVNYHCGVLEGIAGRLGLARPGKENLPHSVREGISRHHAASLTLILKTEEEANKGAALPPASGARWEVDGGLHSGYESDFISHRAGDVHPIFTAPLLPNLVSEMNNLCLSEPAKPPPTPQELWAAIYHSHYDEGKDLCHRLVGLANDFLNPPPLSDPPIPPVTSALTNGSALAVPPLPTVPTTFESIPAPQRPPVAQNLPLSSSQVTVSERPNGSTSTESGAVAQYSFANTRSQLEYSTTNPKAPLDTHGVQDAYGIRKDEATCRTIFPRRPCLQKAFQLLHRGDKCPLQPSKTHDNPRRLDGTCHPPGTCGDLPIPQLEWRKTSSPSAGQILGSAVIQHPSGIAGSIIVGSASSGKLASTGTSQTSVYLMTDGQP